MHWIDHDGQLYNLDKFTQISRGDEDELLLSTESHNGLWNDETKTCSLTFKSKQHRDLAMDMIMRWLETLQVSANSNG